MVVVRIFLHMPTHFLCLFLLSSAPVTVHDDGGPLYLNETLPLIKTKTMTFVDMYEAIRFPFGSAEINSISIIPLPLS